MDLYDIRTWPQAGRDQLHRILIKGRIKYLEKHLKDNGVAAELASLQEKLRTLSG